MPILINALLVSPALLLVMQSWTPWARSQCTESDKPQGQGKSATAKDSKKKASLPLAPLPNRPFVTIYRGSMMVITCLSILAVDFKVFPRRFAKVETWGTSLMDLGVGSFVFSGGIVSARALLKDEKQKSLVRRLLVAIRHSLPLVILGTIRLYSVKGLDYAEHVTEYGVHWNFFFTIALLPPVVEIIHCATKVIPSYEALSFLIAVIYQVTLESTSLKQYILLSPRGPSLLSKNREGVYSFIGYLAIYLAGRAAGLQVMPRRSDLSPTGARKSLLLRLFIWSTIWGLTFYLNSTPAWGYGANIAVSRRIANMPYFLWVAAFNNAYLFLFCLIETLCFPAVHRATDAASEHRAVEFATSTLLAAFNRTGLGIFLLANLLTGLVNISMNTLDASPGVAVVVLAGYAAVLAAAALLMDRYDIRLRL